MQQHLVICLIKWDQEIMFISVQGLMVIGVVLPKSIAQSCKNQSLIFDAGCPFIGGTRTKLVYFLTPL